MKDLLLPIKRFHGSLYEALCMRYSWMESIMIQSRGLRLSRKKKAKSTGEKSSESAPIDFVITWVDGSDPKWLEEKNQYLKQSEDENTRTDNGEARYRDWGILPYWFRAVEKYAPWVQNIYFITYGHLPDWLKQDAPKLKIVKHEDFIPKKYLPTFNSTPIELNIHRIQELSEHFVYFNDDVFLCSPVKPSDFFRGGEPNLTAIAEPLRVWNNNEFEHKRFVTVGVVNNYFGWGIKKTIRKNPEKWFLVFFGEKRQYNRLSYEAGILLGMIFPHVGVPFRKSTMGKVWEAIPDVMDSTCYFRFRNPKEVIHQVFTLWEMAEGSFNAVGPKHHGKVFTRPQKQYADIMKALLSKEYKMICINDSPDVSHEDYLSCKERIVEAFQIAFPEKSSFEK